MPLTQVDLDFYYSLPEELREDWLYHRQACDKSLFHFICEMGAFSHDAGEDSYRTPIWKEICDFWQDPTIKRKAVFMARKWYKSTNLSVSGNLWSYLQDNSTRILMPSQKIDLPKSFIKAIKTRVMTNRRLRYLYPILSKIDAKWKHEHVWGAEACEFPGHQGQPDPTFKAIGVTGGAQGGHAPIIAPDDIVGEKAMESKAVLIDAQRWFDNIEELTTDFDVDKAEGSVIRITGCLTKDTDILMGDNTYKKISDIVSGDIVWTMGEDGTAEKRTVELMIPQGIADVWEVKTAHQSIRGTNNHPILLETGEWKKIEDIKTEDRIVASNIIDGKESIGELESWFLGLFLGDGTAVDHHGTTAICIADGTWEGIREKTIIAYEGIIGKTPKLGQHGQWIAWSKEYGRRLKELGLFKKATEKTIPPLIYSLIQEERLSFIRGLVDADGTVNNGCHDSYTIEVANERLVRDIKKLCQISGISSGSIRSRIRTIKPPYSPNPVTNTFWSISINIGGGRSTKVINKNFLSERVVEVKKVGKEDVYDLVIDGNHNFIANGIVVHNTHWGPGDIGCYIQENYPAYKWMIVPALKDDSLEDTNNIKWLQDPNVENGQSNWEWNVSTKTYLDMKNNPEKSMIFWSQHQNNPSKANAFTAFDKHWLKFYRWEEDSTGKYIVCSDDKERIRLGSFLTYGFVDPGGFSTKTISKKGGSRSAVLIGGQPRGGYKKFITYTWCGQFKEPKVFLDEIFKAHDAMHPYLWRQEIYGQQDYILQDIKSEAKTRRVPLRIIELESDCRKDAKDERIQALIKPMFNGEIYVHESMRELISEINDYPGGMTKDLLDLLAQLNQTYFTRGEKPALKTSTTIPEEASGADSITGY